MVYSNPTVRQADQEGGKKIQKSLRIFCENAFLEKLF